MKTGDVIEAFCCECHLIRDFVVGTVRPTLLMSYHSIAVIHCLTCGWHIEVLFQPKEGKR